MLCRAELVRAQQGVMFSQYIFNGLVLNPAYAGYKEKFNAALVYRNQWVGIESAPTTITLMADATVLNNLIGIGGHIMSDKVGAQQTLSIMTDYSYRLQLDKAGSRLALGLSIGLTQLSLDESLIQFDDPNDPLIASGLLGENFYRPDFNVGVFYDSKLVSAGLSLTELWGDYKIVKKSPQMYVTASMLIPINRDFMIRPSLLYKDDFKMQPSVDISAFGIIKDKFWVGLLWRNGLPFSGRLTKDVANVRYQSSINSITILLNWYIKPDLNIGYAWDVPLSKLNQVSLGSHEITLGFSLGKRAQRVLTPRYF
jgi:type IX secretion system PorP/SprF family membrane protein